ncbi:MAG: hypothetical protein J6S67_08130 [Methanobrevibacter sp.]|nr:hypothetical protein [Methanobrevibacter sp.]
MAYHRKYSVYVGDFETTTYEGQDYTEVWASALVKLHSEDVIILHSIDETLSYLLSLNDNVIVYYHNLKFDGYFWIDYFMVKLGLYQAVTQKSDKEFDPEFMSEADMPNNTFKYLISDRGQWYNIILKKNNKMIVFRDSLKLLPFSVKEIGKSFDTKHKKLDMEYKGFRYAGCEITEKEREYIANDVLVVKEALEIMYRRGHTKTTIGSCCLEEFKKTLQKGEWEMFFPDLRDYPLDEKVYGSPNVEAYVRHTYKGGWCYLVDGKENKIYTNGLTADVNSLYPSMMSSESGNTYPIGEPHCWHGNYIPNEAQGFNKYFFVRVSLKFKIKPNMLPTIQIKGSPLYRPTEWLKTSDIYDRKTGKYHKTYKDVDGEIHSSKVILSLTCVDYNLMLEHYDVEEFEILDGCWFYAITSIFDDYIDKYRRIKENSVGAERQLAKLFLNNLYGKMATSPNSDHKIAFVTDKETVSFIDVSGEEKKPIFIPIGSAITSYARRFTITAAQANYHGKDKAGFIYADTDSIHCDIPLSELKGVPIHNTAFCNWKIESQWDKAIFVRQKTYMEHQPCVIDQREAYDIKCAGMPDKCKELLLYSMVGYTDEEYEKLSKEGKEFVKVKRTMEDFKVGLKVPDKLLPKRIKGGIVLQETTYEMR